MRLLQGEVMNKEQLRERLKLGPRSVDELIRTKKIPVIKIGHRTVRFCWPDVAEALERLTHKAIE
jgi:hypothetical protein